MLSQLFIARISIFGRLLFACLGGIEFRLFSLQVLNHGLYRSEVTSRLTIDELLALRGEIFDRNGEVLAKDVETLTVCACPRLVRDPEGVAARLAPLLAMEERELQERLVVDASSVVLKTRVPAVLGNALRNMRIDGIYWVREARRFYPKAPLFSAILGFVGKDRKGLEGLEYVFDSVLEGRNGYVTFERDALGQEIPTTITVHPPEKGNNLHLTLDTTVQFFAEEALRRAIERTKAKRGVVIVNNPKTGDILAMASYPSFDNQSFERFPPEHWRNYAVHMVIEPGSTVKPLVLAAALEEKVASLRDTFSCSGGIRVHNHRVRCIKTHGEESLEDVLINSCNAGIISIVQRLGKEKLYAYLRNFGLGEKTGVPLPGEERGLLRRPEQWSLLSIGAVPIGQEMMVTPMQLLYALSSIANRGILMRPRLVSRVTDAHGRVIHEIPPSPVRRVVSERTANLVLSMMEKAVKEGTGKKAQVAGYRIAGKTGTGQKAGPGGRYVAGAYYSSFVGFFPLPDPCFGVLVVLDEPEGEYYGGDIAAPVFQEVAENILRYRGVISEDAEVETF
ncbi:MAG: penicillin-binding protein 2 [Candidatus Caldatribacterium sp.]|nr:penicillin-binding protein 2 [Candidatus Caldatribacterium sp.]